MHISELVTDKALVKKATSNRGLYPDAGLTNEKLHLWWIAFQTKASQLGIPLRVVYGYRSFKLQDKLFAKRVTKARAGQSPHNYGLALDIIHTTRAWEKMPREGWEILGALGKEVARSRNISLTWGGDWNFYDPAHWEIKGWKAMAFDMLDDMPDPKPSTI